GAGGGNTIVALLPATKRSCLVLSPGLTSTQTRTCFDEPASSVGSTSEMRPVTSALMSCSLGISHIKTLLSCVPVTAYLEFGANAPHLSAPEFHTYWRNSPAPWSLVGVRHSCSLPSASLAVRIVLPFGANRAIVVKFAVAP